MDPFLLLDELGPISYEPGQAVGAPHHPHRGFETVTYVLEGESEHEDSAGHRGTLGAGDVQWAPSIRAFRTGSARSLVKVAPSGSLAKPSGIIRPASSERLHVNG